MALRIIFMGTPHFAVPSLDILVRAGYDIAAIVTATDKPGGRGRQTLISSAIKQHAQSLQIPILQPPNLKHPDFVEALQAFKADLHVVVAFRMLPENVWRMPRLGTMNLHGSLLPAYRGAAPINWAIINGETVTGVTTFLLQQEIDTGNILLQREITIGADETAGELHDRMMHIGAEVVLDSVRGLENGTVSMRKQDDTKASHAPKLNHQMCRIDFRQPAKIVHNFIRGLSPLPCAWTRMDGQQLNVYRSACEDAAHQASPGTILVVAKGIVEIACGTGRIRLLEVQLQGKRRMSVHDFLNGYKIRANSVELPV